MRTVHPIWYRWLKIQGLAHRLNVTLPRKLINMYACQCWPWSGQAHMKSKHWKCWGMVPVVCWWLWGEESIIAWLSKSTLLSNIDNVVVSWTRCLSCMAIINKNIDGSGEWSPNAYCLWKSELIIQHHLYTKLITLINIPPLTANYL